MGYYVRCPQCGNMHEGDAVRRCECGTIYCDRCAPCPKCGRTWLASVQIGTIG